MKNFTSTICFIVLIIYLIVKIIKSSYTYSAVFSFPIVNTKLHGMFWKYLHYLLLDDPTCPSSFYSYVSRRDIRN